MGMYASKKKGYAEKMSDLHNYDELLAALKGNTKRLNPKYHIVGFALLEQ